MDLSLLDHLPLRRDFIGRVLARRRAGEGAPTQRQRALYGERLARLHGFLENLEDQDYMGSFQNGNYYSGSPNSPYPGGGASGFYGCTSGVCVSVSWDPQRPGPACDPNYGSPTCYGQCTDGGTGAPINECQPWQ